MSHDEEVNENNSSKKFKIIILGLLVHALLIFAVFDIYFSSPLDHGMKSIKSTNNPPAKRVVLFVADGLRAEAVYSHSNMERIPFLKSIIENNMGSWGIAHTRVPTESRPGHVALLAGIYEDPSAILKGWKANPVYFDSVINQSENSWCWGSPDILNIFNKDHLNHIHMETYDANLEDFGDKNSALLDLWVFEKVQEFLQETVQKCNKFNCEKFHSRGNFFFLHLLGIDTAGHGFKPHSEEYIQNIRLVDENVKKITQLFEETFPDGKTAFIFTADHGMTDWGSHGAGSLHETEAPFITWSAGVKKNILRQDIKQIDIAPFLASLIGVNIPSNSFGKVPVQYFDLPANNLAEIQFSNTLQLLEIFNIKRIRTEENALIFLPYKGLTSELLDEKIKNLEELREAEKFNLLIEECKKFSDILIEGLDFYHTYYQYPLLVSISIGFIGWIFYLIDSIIIIDDGANKKMEKSFPKVRFIIMLNIPIFLCFIQSFPVSYYVYFSFPFLIFTLLFDIQSLHKISFNFGKISKVQILSNLFVYIIGLELLVYGFFNRASFSVLAIIIGIWILSSNSFGKYANKRDKILWLILCILLSIFPLFPVMKTTFNMPMYILGTLAWILLFYEMFCRLHLQNQFRNVLIRYKIFYIQLLCLISASIYSILIEYEIIANNSMFKYFSWILLFLPIILIPFTSTLIAVRLIATFFGFSPFYLLVSSNFEALFSAIYVAILCNWLLIECKSFNAIDSTNLLYYVNFDTYRSKPKINHNMFRRAFLFMVFIFIGFFGTGNIASLNSFDPMWVRAFLTVFSPFKMMGLILLKIIVPFLFACCVFRAINSIGKENILQMFCIILIFSDIMVLQFLYLITNVGSWLDIGSSLSHFVIMEGFVTILLLLYSLTHFLTTSRYGNVDVK